MDGGGPTSWSWNWTARLGLGLGWRASRFSHSHSLAEHEAVGVTQIPVRSPPSSRGQPLLVFPRPIWRRRRLKEPRSTGSLSLFRPRAIYPARHTGTHAHTQAHTRAHSKRHTRRGWRFKARVSGLLTPRPSWQPSPQRGRAARDGGAVAVREAGLQLWSICGTTDAAM